MKDEEVSKMWHIHKTEYYSASREKILKHVTSWMNPEDIM